MFQAVVDSVAGNLALSALVACIPLAAFFIMLVGVKAKAHVSALVALVVALIVAIFAFGMPAHLAALSGLQGACYGAFPIVFIIIMAVWFYEVTVVSGRSEDLKSLFDIVGGGDIRIQAVLVAFCFGGLLEALAGFGAPIAITATMILALGVKPSKAALAVLIANTAPVAYGAAGTPITTAGNMVAGGDASVALESAQHVAAIVGYQAPLFALFVPLLVVLILDGKKGLRDCWLHALVIGGSFAVTQWWCSNHFAYELTDVVASLVSLGVSVIFLHFVKPKNVNDARERFGMASIAEGEGTKLAPVRAWMALVPYIIVVVVFAICKLGIPALLASTDIKIPFPGLAGNVLNAAGKDPGTTYNLNLLSNPGTMLLIAGLLTTIVYGIFNEKGKYRITLGMSAKQLGQTFWAMRFSSLTIVMVLGLAYIMNHLHRPVPRAYRCPVCIALARAWLGWHRSYRFGHFRKRAVLQPSVRSCPVERFAGARFARPLPGSQHHGRRYRQDDLASVAGNRRRHHRRARVQPLQEGHPLECWHAGCAVRTGIRRIERYLLHPALAARAKRAYRTRPRGASFFVLYASYSIDNHMLFST